MFKTIAIIIVSVSIFGLILFVNVKNSMKKRIDYYLRLNEKNTRSELKKLVNKAKNDLLTASEKKRFSILSKSIEIK